MLAANRPRIDVCETIIQTMLTGPAVVFLAHRDIIERAPVFDHRDFLVAAPCACQWSKILGNNNDGIAGSELSLFQVLIVPSYDLPREAQLLRDQFGDRYAEYILKPINEANVRGSARIDNGSLSLSGCVARNHRIRMKLQDLSSDATSIGHIVEATSKERRLPDRPT